MRNPKKRDQKARELADSDLFALFLRGKSKGLQSKNLRSNQRHSGSIVLSVKREDKWVKYAELAKIDGVISKRTVLVIDPSVATAFLLRSTFGGFDPSQIKWVKGLVALNYEQARSIYEAANSPLLNLTGNQDEQSTDNSGSDQ